MCIHPYLENAYEPASRTMMVFKTLFGCGAIAANLLMEICRVIYYSSSAHCKESLLGEQAYIVGAFLSLSHECTLELMYLLSNYIL